MAHKSGPIYVHVSTWQEKEVTPDDETVVWNAHRPIRGAVAWQGQSRYGVHYAAARRDDARYEYFEEENRRDDARRVVLVNNRQAIALAEARCEEQGRGKYGLEAYLGAYPGDEGARMFVETYDLPWVDGDTSADELLGKA